MQDEHTAVNLSTCGEAEKQVLQARKVARRFSAAVLLLFAWRRPRCFQLKYLSAEQIERLCPPARALRLVGCFLWARDELSKILWCCKSKSKSKSGSGVLIDQQNPFKIFSSSVKHFGELPRRNHCMFLTYRLRLKVIAVTVQCNLTCDATVT